jgi:hypothetical protein
VNLGLSDFLKSEFNGIMPVKRQIINTQSTNNIGYRVQLRFRISQHERDLKLMECLIKYLGSGKIYKYTGKPAVVLTVFKFSDITNIIIPFFGQYPLLGVKLFDYLDWCKIAKLMNKGSHLTLEGLNLIRDIKSGMNTGRN